jgi:nitrogen fixation-related uncharacterized protein
MAKESKTKRKNKGKKGNKPPIKRPPPTTPPPQLPPEKPSSGQKPSLNNGRTNQFWKRLGSVLTIALGLLAVIPFLPRPSPEAILPSPTDPDQLGASRFTITNDGYWKLTDVKAVCFLWRVQYGQGDGRYGKDADILVEDSLETIISPPENILAKSETMTVPCTPNPPVPNGYTHQPFPLRKADIAIAFYYKPWPITFLRRHRLFRFVARLGRNRELLGWDREPASILEPEFEEFMKRTNGEKGL